MGGDSLCFAVVAKRYAEGDCLEVIEVGNAYVEHYPKGRDSVRAAFYLASCYLKNRDTANAVPSLERLAGWPSTEHYMNSLLILAPYLERRGEYAKALRHFELLERENPSHQARYDTRRGMLHCAVQLGDNEKIIDYAKAFLALGDTPEELREYAKYQKARSEVLLGRMEEAYDGFAELGLQPKKNPIAAEARYRMMQIRYSQKRWETLMPLLKDFVRQRTVHRYWLGKSHLLMAQAQMYQGEFAKASELLLSLRKNYDEPDDGVVQESKDLDLLIKKVRILNEDLPPFDPAVRFEKGGYEDGK
ncbi:MAG: hypothetical protein CSA07_00710 [Bacteroidia bacterium]|nr:MAG: hypothetical protein CSA07_00710 [Bacteroidia bacterium]